MNIKEKAGDLLIDIAKLIVGGVLLASIISENINTMMLYGAGTGVAALLIAIGFLLYNIKNKVLLNSYSFAYNPVKGFKFGREIPHH